MSPLVPNRLDFRSWLYYLGLTIVGIVFLAYALFQARFLIEGPEIFLTNTPPLEQQARTVNLEGTTANIVSLQLNGREIYTDKSGHFKETVVLENGYTIVTFEARDRYGRKTKLEERFVYVPALAQNDVVMN